MVVKCAMTPYQSVIYNWVKVGTNMNTFTSACCVSAARYTCFFTKYRQEGVELSEAYAVLAADDGDFADRPHAAAAGPHAPPLPAAEQQVHGAAQGRCWRSADLETRAHDMLHLPTTISCLQCTVAVHAGSSSRWSFELLLQSISTRLDTASHTVCSCATTPC